MPYNDPSEPFNATTTPANGYDALPKSAGGTGEGTGSTIARSPNVNGFGPPGTTPAWEQPGSDVILGHEMVHAPHNANGTDGDGPVNSDGVSVGEERNTTGLPAQTYTNPGDPLNGTALPDTQAGSPYNENALREDYRDGGLNSPATGKPPETRPS